jgi:hypothetical protein
MQNGARMTLTSIPRLDVFGLAPPPSGVPGTECAQARPRAHTMRLGLSGPLLELAWKTPIFCEREVWKTPERIMSSASCPRRVVVGAPATRPTPGGSVYTNGAMLYEGWWLYYPTFFGHCPGHRGALRRPQR